MKLIPKSVAEKEDLYVRLFLSFISVVFISILVVGYFVARKANPVILDEHGKPIQTK